MIKVYVGGTTCDHLLWHNRGRAFEIRLKIPCEGYIWDYIGSYRDMYISGLGFRDGAFQSKT